MAVLGAPVTLTIGIESQPYLGELSLSLTPSDKDRPLRVAMVVDDEEVTKFEGTLAAGSSVMLIPLSSNVAGEQICRVYLGGELCNEQTVTLR